MSHSHWKGSISFGLVNIPIMLYNSINKTNQVSFHQIDTRNNARIKYSRINSETGKEVPWKNIGKAYEYAKDLLLPVLDAELKKVVGENARTIAIESFVKEDSIDFINIDKTYYILPDKKGEKGYVILREVLKKTHEIAIAKVIISTKEYIGAIAHFKNALVLYLLKYQNEIKPLTEFDFPSDNLNELKITKKELDIATQLVKSMTDKWKPESYKNEYEEVVQQWAKSKIKKKEYFKMRSRIPPASHKKQSKLIDLLKQSINNEKSLKKHHHKAPLASKKHPSTKRAVLH